MVAAPLMPKATAVWLVENTALSFDQVADFCKLHPLEVKAIADGDAAQGIKGLDPILTGQLTREELKGGEPVTTNNRMELMAAISALEALKRPAIVDNHPDSQYLRNGIMSWIHQWKRNGWRTADRNPVKNDDLWKRLDAALAQHRVRWHWVRGHAGHDLNERADRLAREAIAAVRAGAAGALSTDKPDGFGK